MTVTKLKTQFCLKSARLNTNKESCGTLKLGDFQIFCNTFPLLEKKTTTLRAGKRANSAYLM